MKLLSLTRGKFATVDDADFEFLSKWKWRALDTQRVRVSESFYAIRGGRNSVYMHREIAKRIGFDESKQVDHMDGDGLNNKRSNLRACTNGENMRNARKTANRSSQYKGVHWNKHAKKWQARIHVLKTTHLGYFDDEETAAKAYDEAARKHYGSFARLNLAES